MKTENHFIFLKSAIAFSLLLGLGLLMGCSEQPVAPGPETPEVVVQLSDDSVAARKKKGGRIAFTSFRDGNWQIYVMNADGTEQTNISNHHHHDLEPAWSPDGKQIVFRSTRDGQSEIYVMNADGTNPVRLTFDPDPDTYPAWSPDGKQITFVRTPNFDHPDIYVINTDGSGLTNLTNHHGPDRFPAWSPNGPYRKKIAFNSFREGQGGIYVMNIDGTNPTFLYEGRSPDWSPNGPNGKKIVFVQNDGIHSRDIWVIKADGTMPVQLTDVSGFDDHPVWSPDGIQIAFARGVGGTEDIYVMNADGSGLTNLTNHPSVDRDPAWSKW